MTAPTRPCPVAIAGEAIPLHVLPPVSRFLRAAVKGVSPRAYHLAGVMVFPMPNRIVTVGALGVPAQVLKPVIAGVAIVMAPLFAWRARPNKRFKNKPMNHRHAAPVVFPEIGLVVPACAPFQAQDFSRVPAWGRVPPAAPTHYGAVYRPNASTVADLVHSFVASYLYPGFHYAYVTGRK